MKMTRKNIFLIGIDHHIQYLRESDSPNKETIINGFSDFIIENINKFNITLLAEEFSEELLPLNHVKESVLQSISSQQKISHLFCDPNTEERRINNISNTDHNKREKFWFNRLIPQDHLNILFLCGDDHIYSFSKLLTKNNFSVVILKEKCGTEISNPLFQ